MSIRVYLNDGWGFLPEFSEKILSDNYNFNRLKEVRLPHTLAEITYNYADETAYQLTAGYYKKIRIPRELEKKKLLLHFEGVAQESVLYINGVEVKYHGCGYTEFAVDITEYVCFGDENRIVVKVSGREDGNIPPFGNVIDYMTYGGIYRDVYLEIKNTSYIKDVFVKTNRISKDTYEMSTEAFIENLESDLNVIHYLYEYDRVDKNEFDNFYSEGESLVTSIKINTVSTVEPMELTPLEDGADSREKKVLEKVQVSNLVEWSVYNPKRYLLETILCRQDEILDVKHTIVGFRQAQFTKKGFLLNGEPLKLVGLNRHQSYPYVGYAMPKSMQEEDALILKKQLGVNCVRTSHYPQSQYFLDKCDEIGLLVFTEIPGWQHIGDDDWKKQALKNVEDMILQNRNHPSIILWGVRINESQDDDDFYIKTNALARRLDPTRQTSGVRFLKKSHSFEDVYAFNDFSHEGNNRGITKKNKVVVKKKQPYLISEFNGHMFPAKTFDGENHRLEHAIRHANVMDGVMGDKNVSGAIGWCMADYNTHKEFGSGDRICYHGVLDMFRNSKMAAYMYQSQQDMEDVFFISSSMDIGDHPAGRVGTVVAFTNADKIRVYKNDEFIREYMPDKKRYPNLAHPPILMDDFIGDLIEKNEKYSKSMSKDIKKILLGAREYGYERLPLSYKLLAAKLILFRRFRLKEGTELFCKYVGDWGGRTTTYRFEAVKEDKICKVIEKGPVTRVGLKVEADHTNLVERFGYDVAAVRIQALDQCENLLPYFQEPVELKVKGDLEIIGPKIISLKGGMGGTFVRSKGKETEGFLQIKTAGCKEEKIVFTVNMVR